MKALAIAALLTVVALPASATDAVTDPEVSAVALDFEYGKYADVLKRVQARLDRGSLSEGQLVELHRYAGLAAFNLNQPAEAQRHLSARRSE